MSFCFGIDELLDSASQLSYLKSKRVGLVAHPASITSTQKHTLDALIAKGLKPDCVFGPQHGMRGEKQDNMIETDDYFDPVHQIQVISLYGEHRRPTAEMLEPLDVIVFDLQDIGCRIYTYIATMMYFADACDEHGVELWILDRPNPAGRPLDGLVLESGHESFVGSAELPTRHGLTMGELCNWYCENKAPRCNRTIVEMTGYTPNELPGFGWPTNESAWVNPSPNAASLNMARCFPGTVLLEGTTLSEGRGTTIPLEVIGAPDFPAIEVLELLRKQRPEWLAGVYIRPCYFEPTFHKHVGQMCHGLQIHTDFSDYSHGEFLPFRLIAGLLKCLRLLVPDYPLWRDHDYEYELSRRPIDVINGGYYLREWVDDMDASFSQLDNLLVQQLATWHEERKPFLLY